MATFKIGDVVRLKSDHIHMTVTSDQGANVQCMWMLNGLKQTDSFPSDALTNVKDDGSIPPEGYLRQ